MQLPSLDQIPAGAWAGLFFLWLALSVLYRRARGKPLFARARPDATFTERWASARAGAGLLSRLSTARNCMQVQVSATELRIHPHFPFTLGFMPELYGLDHVIPLHTLRSATIVSGHRAKAVEVRYVTAAGADDVVLLLLRGAEAFIHAALGRKA
jgi:hypothetical protein